MFSFKLPPTSCRFSFTKMTSQCGAWLPGTALMYINNLSAIPNCGAIAVACIRGDAEAACVFGQLEPSAYDSVDALEPLLETTTFQSNKQQGTR